MFSWTEHDPWEIYKTSLECLENCQKDCKDPISAIGITNQRETTIVWDSETGEPLHKAIGITLINHRNLTPLVWLDMRTVDIVSKLSNIHGKDSLRVRCLLIATD